jgi:methionyl-tRNA formyltransferase
VEDKKIQKVVFLAAPGRATNIIYNSLKEDFEIAAVIIERPFSKKTLLKKRIKKLGIFTVMGQVAFQIFIGKTLAIFSSKRINSILEEFNLADSEINASLTRYVSSVNNEDTAKILMEISPNIVIINGTRIISKKILSLLPGRFINMHAGITPKYRGVHGAYWALANKNPEHCGVTVHLVDSGIDTGTIISSAIVKPSVIDNFSTYPYLQIAIGIPLLKEAIRSFPDNLRNQKTNHLPSKLWYHPTIVQYLLGLIFKGVK